MARLGKHFPPPFHGRFASPPPTSFCPSYPLADSFPFESVPNLSLSLCHSLYKKGHSCFHILYHVKEGGYPTVS
jgi:hypothetical protein